jgi:hypothetical protein
LLGESIIDANTEVFCRELPVCKSGTLVLERAWLLASLLHDFGIPYQNTQWSNGIPEIKINLTGDRRNKHAIDEIVRHFCEVKGEEHKGKIESILYKKAAEMERIDHGLISAIRLVRKSMEVKNEVYEKEVLPAALSISLHNQPMWNPLIRARLLPIDLKTLPIPFLLALADNLEAWGRPGFKSDPQGRNTILSQFEVKAGALSMTLGFKDLADAILTKWEIEEILSHVVDLNNLFKIKIDYALFKT